MTDMESKALQAKEKMQAAVPAEQTKPGPVFTPAVDIYETETDIMVLADMPGVTADGLLIDLRENVLTFSGEVTPPEKSGETDVLREYQTGRYYRQFSLSEVIDQGRIEAELKDGVLQLKLPKVEEAKPRRIQVKAA